MQSVFRGFLLVAALLMPFTGTLAQAESAQSLFLKGLGLHKERRLDEALEAFRKSARIDPNRPATFAIIGQVLMDLGRASEAIDPLREAVRLNPRNADFRAGLCNALRLNQNHVEAIQQCEEGVRLNVASLPGHLALILALKAAGRVNEAAQRADFALQRFGEELLLLNLAADVHSIAGNYSRAVEILQLLARRIPNSALYQVYLAENYLKLEMDSEALASARRAIELEPKNPMAHFFAGRVYFELGQHAESADAFSKATEFGPIIGDAFHFLALSESRRGRKQAALAAIRKAILIKPDDGEFLITAAEIFISTKNYDEAVLVLRKAVVLFPNDYERRSVLGLAYLESSNFDEAISQLQIADQMKPGNRPIQMLLNVARSRREGVAEIPEVMSALEKDPKDINARIYLAQLLVWSKRYEESDVHLQEALNQSPDKPDLFQYIAVAYTVSGRTEKAIDTYQRGSEKFPTYPGFALGLAMIYRDRGRFDDAVREYNRMLELKPDAAETMKIYGDMLLDNGRRREALQMYNRSLQFIPNDAPTVFNAGLLAAKLGEKESALASFELLRLLDPARARKLERCLRLLGMK